MNPDISQDLGYEALACDNKLKFDSEKEAKAAAQVADFQHGTKLKVYKCRHCGLWHLSSQPA